MHQLWVVLWGTSTTNRCLQQRFPDLLSNTKQKPYCAQGLQASLIGVLPYAGIRLAVYDGLKWGHRKYTKKEKIAPVPTMVYGAFAGLLSASATFPVEVVRSAPVQQHL